MVSRRCLLAALLLAGLLAACDDEGTPGIVIPPDASTPLPAPDAGSGQLTPRCEVPLERFYAQVPGAGAPSAKQLASAADGIGGPNAQGKAGDWLLANDKIKVVVQARYQGMTPNPWGGSILDADLVRDGPGQDQYGKLGLVYSLGRTLDVDSVELVSPGGPGQPVVVAMSGRDVLQGYLRLTNVVSPPSVDPYQKLPLRLTNYFILNPGEQRVRFVTAFCNEGTEPIVTLTGDLSDPGWVVDLFNGKSCTGGFGYGGNCVGLDRMSWFGYQGDGVAYGYAPYKVSSPTTPEMVNGTMTVSFVTGTLIGIDGMNGIGQWLDPNATNRAGELRIPAGGTATFARDFVVGRDLGEVASLIETWRAQSTGASTGTLSGTVTRGGLALAGARVTLQRSDTIAGVFVTGPDGKWSGRFNSGTYKISAWALGSTVAEPQTVLLAAEGSASADFALSQPRTLTVTVADALSGKPLPAKVTVLCATNVCPVKWRSLNTFFDAHRDPIPDNVGLIDFVPTSGTASFPIPPGEYRVLVSHGPEWTIFPAGWPADPGFAVDLTEADATVAATLAQVVDTPGFASTDLHVHGVNSPDSFVDDASRALTFAAEGVDVLVASDHDYITDYAPAIAAIGAADLVTSIPGVEISPGDFGHFNAYPLVPDPSDVVSRGSIDWTGGRGARPLPRDLQQLARDRGATTLQLNHPRDPVLGALRNLQVDLDTFATHLDPKLYGLEPAPGATPGDTRLLSDDFDAFEVANGGIDQVNFENLRPLLNDWFTLLSRGLRIAGVGVTDSHQRFASAAGGWRTWVKVPDDAPAKVTWAQVSGAVNALRAVVGNGPYVEIQAARIAPDGTPTSPAAGVGDCLPASGDEILVTLDIQAPPSITFNRVELYLHTPADDASCPIDPASPQALTTRVACAGYSNYNWPASSIAATEAFTLGDSDKKVVSGTWWRWQKRVTFRIPAPATDNWIVAMVYGEGSTFPLAYPNKLSNGGAAPIRPFSFTNPIFVDADGNGYDHPPFAPSVP